MALPENVDASSLVFSALKDGDLGAAVRALLVNGADSVLEAGDMTAKILTDTESARRADPSLEGKALALAVQDAGEDRLQRGIFRQYVVVRVYDRFCGYRNIRAVRQVLRVALHGFVGVLVPTPGVPSTVMRKGVLTLGLVGRTGHRFDLNFAVEYEAVSFLASVEQEEAD